MIIWEKKEKKKRVWHMFENYPTKSSSEQNLKENIFCLLIVFLYESQLLLIEIFQNFDGNIFFNEKYLYSPPPLSIYQFYSNFELCLVTILIYICFIHFDIWNTSVFVVIFLSCNKIAWIVCFLHCYCGLSLTHSILSKVQNSKIKLCFNSDSLESDVSPWGFG